MKICCLICKKEIGSRGFGKHLKCKHNISYKEYRDKYIDINLPLCACGCGQHVIKLGNRYINGHQRKGKIAWNENLPRSEKTKQKISKNQKDYSGKNNPMYGKIGKNSPNYKHGFTFTRRNNVKFLKSKNYTCERCKFQELPENRIGKKLRIHIHHIIERTEAPDKINDFSNLCCLCNSCHQKYHRKNKGNINENSLQEFLKL